MLDEQVKQQVRDITIDVYGDYDIEKIRAAMYEIEDRINDAWNDGDSEREERCRVMYETLEGLYDELHKEEVAEERRRAETQEHEQERLSYWSRIW